MNNLNSFLILIQLYFVLSHINQVELIGHADRHHHGAKG